jgi:hypothetical protein
MQGFPNKICKIIENKSINSKKENSVLLHFTNVKVKVWCNKKIKFKYNKIIENKSINANRIAFRHILKT